MNLDALYPISLGQGIMLDLHSGGIGRGQHQGPFRVFRHRFHLPAGSMKENGLQGSPF